MGLGDNHSIALGVGEEENSANTTKVLHDSLILNQSYVRQEKITKQSKRW
jgi:hypothetical protein